MNNSTLLKPSRRDILKFGAAGAALSMPFVNRAWAQTLELNMLAWYGHGEPDVVAEFEQANNVKFKPKFFPARLSPCDGVMERLSANSKELRGRNDDAA